MKKSKTNRGFALYKFKDAYGGRCSLQQSFTLTEVWLGLDPISIDPTVNRMLIDRKLAKKLALKLAAFAETGEI